MHGFKSHADLKCSPWLRFFCMIPFVEEGRFVVKAKSNSSRKFTSFGFFNVATWPPTCSSLSQAGKVGASTVGWLISKHGCLLIAHIAKEQFCIWLLSSTAGHKDETRKQSRRPQGYGPKGAANRINVFRVLKTAFLLEEKTEPFFFETKQTRRQKRSDSSYNTERKMGKQGHRRAWQSISAVRVKPSRRGVGQASRCGAHGIHVAPWALSLRPPAAALAVLSNPLTAAGGRGLCPPSSPTGATPLLLPLLHLPTPPAPAPPRIL